MKISKLHLVLWAVLASILPWAVARAQTLVYSQPHNGAGATLQSSYWDPDGSDYDQYVWDGFLIPDGSAITEVRWRGGYPGSAVSTGGNITKFKVAIYASIPAGTQPDLGYMYPGPLVSYTVNGKAGEAYAGTFNGTALYDYHYTLPTAFMAAANTRYWLQVEAWQPGIPNWGMAPGSGGNGTHFHRISYVGDAYYFNGSGDAAFSLYTTSAPTVTISASVVPAGAGTVTGAGAYPTGSSASLHAAANAGYGFVNWTENGTQVSTNPTYALTANANRTLVAHFAPAYTITTSASPGYGGTTSGGGTFIDGAPVTLTATPAPHFVFAGWSDGSMDQVHTFNAWADMQLTAWFDTEPGAAAFDFDAGPGMRSLPIAWTVNGLTATFNGGYSTQQGGLAPNYGIGPFYYLYPNSVFQSDLTVDFSESLTSFSIMYSTQELGCDTTATMRVTVYQDGAQVATNTNTGPATGSWPINTITISAPAGFNRAVVHYDARPAICADWGPIFFADNVVVTRACAPAAVAGDPGSVQVCAGQGAGLGVLATGSAPMAYQWSYEDPGAMGTWLALADGALTINGSVWGTVSGSTTDVLSVQTDALAPSLAAGLNFRCDVGNACGSATSAAASVTVVTCCPADLDDGTGTGTPDGGVDINDLLYFLVQYEAGTIAADLDDGSGTGTPDGGVDINDLLFFLTHYEAGC